MPSNDKDDEPSSSFEAITHFLLKELTVSEKLSLLSGKSMWSLPKLPRNVVSNPRCGSGDQQPQRQQQEMLCSDGPHGVRKQLTDFTVLESHPATCFPAACAIACSWDESLVQKMLGPALSVECVHYGISLLLGPGMNLKRHPAGGRNFEYYSEDPLLSGRMARAMVSGIQASDQVSACIKHFCINNQETCRFVVDAVVDERTARELYYKGFEYVIRGEQQTKQQPAAVMCAYNKVNGIFCSEHKELLTNILRTEWGFRGIVLTDWGATNCRVKGIAAGVDLEMPGSYGLHDRAIQRALKQQSSNKGLVEPPHRHNNQQLTMAHIDACAERMINFTMQQHQNKNSDGQQENSSQTNAEWKQAHADLARDIARECIVLLKNKNNLLPLLDNQSSSNRERKKEKLRLAVIGSFGKDNPRYQGMGSSQVNACQVLNAYDELQKFVAEDICYAPGYQVDAEPSEIDLSLLDEAVAVSQKADVVILFCGLDEISESEGFDRTSLSLPAQHVALIECISMDHASVVLVLCNGGTVILPDVCHTHVSAILEAHLLGQSGGGAIADIIFGVQSPCAKLAESMPLQSHDLLADRYFPGNMGASTATATTTTASKYPVVEYREGLDVGYRYLNTTQKPVWFPFGHGLSYTSFEYSGLQVKVIEDKEKETMVNVSLTLTNVGSMAGSEIVQCYVHDVDAHVYRPLHELRDFSKIPLEPGESKSVEFNLSRDAFAFYDIGYSDWVVEPGQFEIQIGSSSRDIRLREKVSLKAGREASLLARESYPPIMEQSRPTAVNNTEFAKRFGKKQKEVMRNILIRQSNQKGRRAFFDRNTLLKDVMRSRILGYLLFTLVYKGACKDIARRDPSEKRKKKLLKENLEFLPIRALALFGQGMISLEMLDAFIACLNYKWSETGKGLVLAFSVFALDLAWRFISLVSPQKLGGPQMDKPYLGSANDSTKIKSR